MKKTWNIRILDWPSFEYKPGKDPWRVVKAMLLCINAKFYTVPEGYRTDGASVPRIPFIYSRYGNTAQIPALFHDFLYDGCLGDEFTRRDADEVFLAMMTELNDPPGKYRRLAMYYAVRLFGWRAWHKNPTWKRKDADTT